MKLRGKYREVWSPVFQVMAGTFWPRTRDEAFVENVAFYWPVGSPQCRKHPSGSTSKVYTVSDLQVCCAREQAYHAYQEAKYLKEPMDHAGAAAPYGIDYYWVMQEGKYCGHVGKRTLEDKCWTCEQEKKTASPRQRAKFAGETWYMPAHGDECKHCGKLARRRVANGSCEECERRTRTGTGGTQERETLIQNICPDLIISKADAIQAGFKVFRTGEPCKRGHTGWRHVSTGGCIDCKTGV